MIISRKHPRFNQHMNAALAAMLLPAAALATEVADAGIAPAVAAVAGGMHEVNVHGQRDNAFKADKASSPKYTEALVDTAQTITVIKKELIEQQGAVTLTEALRNTPGVGAFFLGENGSTNTGDAIFMRGFDASASIFVDGVRDVGSISRDVFNIEQIDVLKGPAGTDNGRSSPTGSVNLVSKQPLLEQAYNGSVTVGSGSQKRATADLNTVIDSASGTAFRLNLLDQDSGNPGRHEVKNKRWAVAPTLAFGLGSPTRIYLDYLHVQQNNRPDGGVLTIGLPGYSSPDVQRPFIGNAPPVDPKNYYGSTLDFDHVKADMLTVRVEHDFASGARFVNTTRYGKTRQDYLLTSFTATTANLVADTVKAGSDPSTWTFKRTNLTAKDQSNDILTNQSTVTVDLATGALRHTVVAGLELTAEKQINYGYVFSGALPEENIYRPDPGLPVNVTLARSGVRSEGSTNTQSAYAFDTIKLGERWIFNGGVRVDRYSTTYDAVTMQAAVTAPAIQTIPVGTLLPLTLESSGKLINGKLSALYKPTSASSVYAVVATSKAPPGGNTFALSAQANNAANPKFDPQSTTTTELGTKWDLLKQKLSLTAALYRTTVRNEVEQDLVDAQYYQTGRKRVQGVELGVTGELKRNWLVSAGYARMNTSVESGKIATASGNNSLTYTPKQALTLWTAYTLPAGVKLGGGARFVDKLLRGTDGAIGTPAYANAYWVFDAMAAYSINRHVDLQLNLYNLADKSYVSAINKSGYRYTPGAPRSASLTANFHF